jgi:4'-phosphopantetheinyl transferase
VFDLRLTGWLSGAPERPPLVLRRLPVPLPAAQLWLIDLDATPRPQAVACLAPEEMERATRFRFQRDRLRYVAGRVWMRHLLARHVGCSIDEIRLGLGPQGKPELLAPDPDLCFNLSHSGHLALLALARGVAVGVDIEQLRSLSDARALAEAHFDAAERAAFDALPSAERSEALMRTWTRKEACLKAWGIGLGLEPARLHVGLSPEACEVPPPDPSFGGSLRVACVTMPENEGFVAALSLGSVS